MAIEGRSSVPGRRSSAATSVLLTALAGAFLLVGPTTVGAQTVDDALQALDTGQHGQAAQWLGRLAEEGNAVAQYRLGNLYYHGQGLPEDETMAVFWWKKAAAHGNAEAMFQIANAYLFGNQAAKYVSDPDREAAVWYFQAASGGHAEAQYHLGLLFLAGKGVVESRPEARRWLKKAAAQGHAEARKALASVDRKPR